MGLRSAKTMPHSIKMLRNGERLEVWINTKNVMLMWCAVGRAKPTMLDYKTFTTLGRALTAYDKIA